MTEERRIEILKLIKQEMISNSHAVHPCLMVYSGICMILEALARDAKITQAEQFEMTRFILEYTGITEYEMYKPYFFQSYVIIPRVTFLDRLIKEVWNNKKYKMDEDDN